jgi:ABC-2 type transport system permease protein
MVGVLVRLKLDVLRHSATGAGSVVKVFGYVLAGILAVGTIVLGTRDFGDEALRENILCLAFGAWTLGWAVAPAVTGGDATLRPRYFATLPIPRRRLALGLIGASMVDPSVVITLLAFLPLVVTGMRLGLAAAITALIALPFQLVLTLALSKVLVAAHGEAEKSRLGKEIAAFTVSFGIAFIVLGPLTLSKLGPEIVRPWSRVATGAIRSLPSSWALVATRAAARGDWSMAALALAGLIALCLTLLWLWADLIERATTRPRSPAARSVGRPLIRALLSSSPFVSTIGKELATWGRDALRGRFLRMAFWTGIMVCAATAFTAGRFMLAFTGGFVALFAGMFCGNLYGADGTALWLTLMRAEGARTDIHGRLAAWLIIIAPLAAALSAAGFALSGDSGAWTLPLMLAVVPALLGGSAGLVMLVSVLGPVVKSDPYERSANRGNVDSNIAGQVFQSWVMSYLVLACALPAAAIVIIGLWKRDARLQWIGAGFGMACGFLLPCLLGTFARRLLERRGPAMLSLFRGGRDDRSGHRERRQRGGAEISASRNPRGRVRARSIASWVIGGFLFAFEGLVPLSGLLAGSTFKDGRFWYLPLYFPEGARQPLCIAFTVIGAAAACSGFFPRRTAR